MTAGLWALLGGLGTAGALLIVVVLYGRKSEAKGRADQRAEEAEGDEEMRADIQDIKARRYSRSESLNRLRRLSDRIRRRAG